MTSLNAKYVRLLWALCMLLCSAAAFAQAEVSVSSARALLDENGAFLSDPLQMELSYVLGLDVDQVFEQYGAPQSMYSLRGEQPWQDDVVFFYPDFRYFYWFENRVWQLRLDNRYEGSIEGARMGMNRSEIAQLFGSPHYEDQENWYYELVDRGYPIRSRWHFDDDILVDLYIYRSDF